MAEGKTIRTRRKAPETESIRLVINGQTYDLNIGNRAGEVEPFHTLSQTLRETLGLTGTKTLLRPGRLRRLHGHHGRERRSFPASS